MKKLIIALITSLAAIPALSADSDSVKLRLSVVEGDRAVEATDFVARMGETIPITRTTTTGYDKVCSMRNGKPEFERGQVVSGLNSLISPVLESPKGAMIRINLSYVELVGIDRRGNPSGCEIDLPRTREMSIGGHTVLLQSGQKAFIPAGIGGRYKFVLERL